jgi:hypothetical protein
MAYNSGYLSGPFYFAGLGAGKAWMYDDTAVAATVIASGYISDGFFRGMEKGDLVFYRQFASLSAKTTPVISLHYVTVCNAAEDTTLSAAYGSTTGLTVPVVSATGTPGVGDDVGDGYALGSIWVETDVDEVYVNTDTTSGAAIWYPITDHFMICAAISDLATPTVSIALPVPVPGILASAYTVMGYGATAALAATALVTLSRNATAITNGVITIANAATQGEVDSCTPTALNEFVAGDVLNLLVSTTAVLTGNNANFVAYFKRKP